MFQLYYISLFVFFITTYTIYLFSNILSNISLSTIFNDIRSSITLLNENEQKEQLLDLLFPNRTIEIERYMRGLDIAKAPYDKNNPVPCVKCRALNSCKALNGLQIEEKYYPKNLNFLETCKVIESFGNRIENEIFGNGKTFRDTPQCRDIVMQYLCLFYGSNNRMYRNYCVFQEDVSSPLASDHKIAPRPPCRSFCVQIASICSNDRTFIQTCLDIYCPPIQDECESDPIIGGNSLNSNIGCSVPYYRTPYKNNAFKSSQLPTLSYIILLIISTIILTLLICDS